MAAISSDESVFETVVASIMVCGEPLLALEWCGLGRLYAPDEVPSATQVRQTMRGKNADFFGFILMNGLYRVTSQDC